MRPDSAMSADMFDEHQGQFPADGRPPPLPLTSSTPIKDPLGQLTRPGEHDFLESDSGLGTTTLLTEGRRTQSLELLSEDASSSSVANGSEVATTGHQSRPNDLARQIESARVKRGKSEEIILNKHKHRGGGGGQRPPFVVPTRPLSSLAQDQRYLSNSSISSAVRTANIQPDTSRRGYYSGCAVHSRTNSESGFSNATDSDLRPR